MMPLLRSAGRSLAIAALLAGTSHRAQALTFHLTYDATTIGAPTGFFTAFQAAIDFFQTTYQDPITINLQVGWGKINGQNLAPGNLGQSSTYQPAFLSYNQVKAALMSDAHSVEDAAALASLPAADPTGGASFVMANAEAKALGLLAANASGIDGYVGFNTNAIYTFNITNRSVTGAYDFYGLACHEISEVMGRYGLGQNGASSGRYSPIDLFRYSAAGALDLTPANGAYFSIDGGNTIINTYNGTGGGDLSDWAGATLDSFNHSLTVGRELPVSEGDLVLMDVIGYDRVIAPPKLAVEPSGPNSLLISWSSPSAGFALQTNTDIATTNWVSANVAISTTNGTNYSTTITPGTRQSVFFRLKR